MNQEIRNKLRNVVTQCRKLLEDSVSQELEGKYGIFAKKDHVTADPNAKMSHLTEEEQVARKDILDHFGHVNARGLRPKEALDQLVREIAFTHLNRLCAYKMMEAREVYVGGQKFREAVSRGINSNGVKFYLADHPEEERLFNTGHQDVAYRHYLDWLGGLLSDEIGVLFNPNDPANRLYPRQKILDEVLDLLNGGGIKPEETELREAWPKIWSQDETIGWVYQYFTPKELRDAARDPKKGGSQAPRNSYELAFRNQFFTPRYVVEFLTDNTLGRIWYEMRKGDTKLRDQCGYMVRRPIEMFLKEGEQPPKDAAGGQDDLSPEELLKLPVHILHRPKKDPRDLKILDPACGSGHFLLYCFDLLLTIYEEAYDDPELGPVLQKDKKYSTLEDLRRDVPRLILAHNVHGIDIDLRCAQIAALALWLRCQRAYQEMGMKKDRPQIKRSNFVCAEPMPGEEQLLKEFVGQLEPKLLGQVVEVVFDKMKLAGEAGYLLKIEEEIRDAVAEARKQWLRETTQATDRKGQPFLFTQAAMDRLAVKPEQPSIFDLTDITDAQFFEQAEAKVIDTLRQYAEKAQNGHRLQRRLFSEDAVRGFAFVDLCRKRYEVVLMNPPFGDPVPTTRQYLASALPTGKHDLCAAMIERSLGSLAQGGALGAITTRTALFIQTFSEWRKRILDSFVLRTVADFGLGVLDAMVETAAYVIARPLGVTNRESAVFSALTASDKNASLIDSIACKNGHSGEWRAQDDFTLIPNSPIAYWVPHGLLRFFTNLTSFNSRGGQIRQGPATADDFRFYRLKWEVSASLINTNAPSEDPEFSKTYWVPMAKGGEYSQYWDDLHLVLLWHDCGFELRNFVDEQGKLRSRPQNLSSFYKPGLTFPYRTTSAFGLRCLPAGCAFSVGGWAIFPPPDWQREDVLAVYNTRFARYFMEVLLGQSDSAVGVSAARNHVAEAVGGIPWPNNRLSDGQRNDVRQLTALFRSLDIDETCCDFSLPRLLVNKADTLKASAAQSWSKRCNHLRKIATFSERVDASVQSAYELDTEDERLISLEEGPHPAHYPKRVVSDDELTSLCQPSIEAVVDFAQAKAGSKRFIVKKSFLIERTVDIACHVLRADPGSVIEALERSSQLKSRFLGESTAEILSYCVGVCLGRWDLRKVGVSAAGDLGDSFATLPVCSPAELVGDEQRPARSTPPNYPIRVNWEGILVDDPDHEDDIERRVRGVLEQLWEHQAEAIEREASDIVDVKELRDYFRKPGKGGFWADHVSRYSKSRRNAPIYWLLQSSRKNYALWLYYQQLDKDLLFKALVNYVEPKTRLETSRLDTLRNQRTAAGISSKEAKRLAKDVEGQEDLLSELRDFGDKLRRAANLHLEPDLNDGVVLNVAPLHELVPWKEAQEYWEELLAGKYEWSSIGKQLRQKGLVK
jgi:hypothetical protein